MEAISVAYCFTNGASFENLVNQPRSGAFLLDFSTAPLTHGRRLNILLSSSKELSKLLSIIPSDFIGFDEWKIDCFTSLRLVLPKSEM